MNLMNNGNKVSFFKILLRDDIDFLPLPVSFAKRYLKKKNNQTLVLKTGSSLKWKVKFLEIEERYYFIHGWLNFIKHNNLQMGDFLVFWLLPPSIFQVFIYAPNGCLKNPTMTSSKGGGTSKNIHKISKKSFVKDKTSDDDSKENVQQSFTRTVSKTCIRTLSMNKRFVKDHLVINGNGNGNGNGRVVLKNKDGKMWEVKVSIYGVGKVPYLTQGWYDFIKDNEIKIGDICEFNHLNNNLLHVHVLKKKGRPFINNP